MLMSVFAVGGEIHFRENAAACPQRQSGNVRELIAGSRAERPALRARIALAERLDRDVVGGMHVLLDEGRRNLQRGGDVVEALRGVVRRQQFGAVDVDQKQIVDRVFVLLAIQPMQHLLIGDVRLVGKLVERIFEPRDQRIDRFAVRLLRARRRHDAAAQLAHGLLEKLGILGDARGRDAFEADAADLGFVVVAARAVLLHGGELRVARILRLAGCDSGQDGQADAPQSRRASRQIEFLICRIDVMSP